MHEIEVVAKGSGWEIVKDMGEVRMVVRGRFKAISTGDARGSRVEFELPDDFFRGLLRQKKAIRKAVEGGGK